MEAMVQAWKEKKVSSEQPEKLMKMISNTIEKPKEQIRAFYKIAIMDGVKKRLLRPKSKTFKDDLKLIIDESHLKKDASIVSFLLEPYLKKGKSPKRKSPKRKSPKRNVSVP